MTQLKDLNLVKVFKTAEFGILPQNKQRDSSMDFKIFSYNSINKFNIFQ